MHLSRTGGRARAIGITISMTVMAAACAGAEADEASVASIAPATSESPEALALVSETTPRLEDVAVTETVELLTAGEAPLVELRFDLEAGSHQLVLSQTQTFDQAINGEDLGVASPQIINSSSTVNVAPQGENYRVDSVIDSMVAGDETSPDIINILNIALAQHVGSSNTTIIDDRGVILQTSTDSESSDLDEMVQTIQGVSNPLPAEPVGVGAMWEHTQHLNLLGFDVEQVTRTTITDIDGDIVTMSIEGSQHVPAGSRVENASDTIVVQSWDVDIDGTTVVDLGQAIPIESTSITTTDQVLEINSAVIDQVLGLEVVVSGS